MPNPKPRLIETDFFPIEFLSHLAERESWRKEIHRPVYHVHKWWAKRLGSVFRGILLGCVLPEDADLSSEFYRTHDFEHQTVFDPFMGSGTTIGEAHKLGMSALGRDINPVAVDAVRTALGPMDRDGLQQAFNVLSDTVGQKIRRLYSSTDVRGRACDVLYFFWVMQAICTQCEQRLDLFPSYIVAKNAYPNRKREVQIVCPECGDIFAAKRRDEKATCRSCKYSFDPMRGVAKGARASCKHCGAIFSILSAIGKQQTRPDFRLYGKLVLTRKGTKEYLKASHDDVIAYENCAPALSKALEAREVLLPNLALDDGHNTRQAMKYGFTKWREFFNDRQLLALGWLHAEIAKIPDYAARRALLTLFSGALEFNNLFASYKGEGTGAVRHMFSHHILKPERMPIEANPWGTPKSSGAFSNLFRSRLIRAIDYREAPTEINGRKGPGFVCSPPFSGRTTDQWPPSDGAQKRGIVLSCGDSATTDLAPRSIDLVVTDPPFFDNVHYSELADFFFAWQSVGNDRDTTLTSTRQSSEVQDADSVQFAKKLQAVFRECHRVMKDDGCLVFSYHHSREEGWDAIAHAVMQADFYVLNSHPVKAEMSVATPKSQAKEPIQLDIILVCRKQLASRPPPVNVEDALNCARSKLTRLGREGFVLSLNDRKAVLFGQLLTAILLPSELASFRDRVSLELSHPVEAAQRCPKELEQRALF